MNRRIVQNKNGAALTNRLPAIQKRHKRGEKEHQRARIFHVIEPESVTVLALARASSLRST
jgi:hypothetical protein